VEIRIVGRYKLLSVISFVVDIQEFQALFSDKLVKPEEPFFFDIEKRFEFMAVILEKWRGPVRRFD
jgi:hypothetical protein